ncbi:MAG: bifunctional 3,4-dihydroxy-2-butanone-4-phosphate synthase/GTP cyclohydrolase II [Candidatus Gastranaerophilales bacterium]|nr:bifunctional 3,4-dihydroxy-2-butanone-4-phosphate synthase/GTP cyclohydrolase II [Candidatus Gastranaerophilales bacterium]
MKFNTVEEAIADIKAGKMIIVADDENRENEGDLICAAELITPEIINFMTKEARGLICLALTTERAKELDLSPMTENNTDVKGTAFTVSIDADPKFGVSTGISAYDRATTIKIATDKRTQPDDFRRPGHIFPLIAKKGGVLQRVGHTEASVDLARFAGLNPSGVLCEIMNEDGSMARRDDLFEFAKKHDIKFITVADLIAYRVKEDRFVKRVVQAKLPTEHGEFEIYGYLNTLDNTEHVALVKGMGEGRRDKGEIPYVRMHSECLTGDIFHSLKCDCGKQLQAALSFIDEKGYGALVYLKKHEGRGIGLLNKLKAYVLQDQGQDTVEANLSLGFAPDLRDYGVGAQILLDLGFEKMNLITNNPKKIIGLEGYGLEVVERVSLPASINKYNKNYMMTKQEKMSHLLQADECCGCATCSESHD